MTLQESYNKFVNKELQRDQFKNILNRSQFNKKLFTPSNSIEDSVKILINRGILHECKCEEVSEGWQEKMPEDYEDDLKAAGLGEVRDDFDTLDQDREEDYYTDDSGNNLHPDKYLDRDMGKKTYQGIDVDTLYAAAKAELPYTNDPKEAFETALANLKVDANYYDDPNWMNRTDDNINEIDPSLGGFAADAALVGGTLAAALVKFGIDKFNQWRQKPAEQKRSDLVKVVKAAQIKNPEISQLLTIGHLTADNTGGRQPNGRYMDMPPASAKSRVYDDAAKQLIDLAKHYQHANESININETVDAALTAFRSKGKVNELSHDTVQNASTKMQRRGQFHRADDLERTHFRKLVGLTLNGDTTITGAKFSNAAYGTGDRILKLTLSFDGRTLGAEYHVKSDQWAISVKVDRKGARVLGSIAKLFNPDTKYGNGTGDLKVIGY